MKDLTPLSGRMLRALLAIEPRKALGLLLLLFAALVAAMSAHDPPPREGLVAVEGTVEHLALPSGTRKAAPPVIFQLIGSPRVFYYISKAGGQGAVEHALSGGGAKVRVLVDPNDDYSTIYEISVNDRVIRSYAEVVAAWRSDDRIGRWGAAGLALAGAAAFALGVARRRGPGPLESRSWR